MIIYAMVITNTKRDKWGVSKLVGDSTRKSAHNTNKGRVDDSVFVLYLKVVPENLGRLCPCQFCARSVTLNHV
jgi:hypothetical protein